VFFFKYFLTKICVFCTVFTAFNFDMCVYQKITLFIIVSIVLKYCFRCIVKGSLKNLFISVQRLSNDSFSCHRPNFSVKCTCQTIQVQKLRQRVLSNIVQLQFCKVNSIVKNIVKSIVNSTVLQNQRASRYLFK